MINDPNTQKVITTVAYSSSLGTAAGGAVSVNELAILAGIVFALGTFLVNWTFQHKRNMREAEIYRMEKKLLKAKMEKLEQVG